MSRRGNQNGFTLIELIMAMVVMGILAASLMVFFKPTIDGYFDARRRADLTDIADTALRRVAQDVRRAVPNSLNLVDSSTDTDGVACFQLVPSVGGGRYRTDIDADNDDATCPASGVCAKYLDTSAAASTAQTFDILMSQGTAPAKDAIVVINNQDADDVYNGPSRAQITNTVVPPPRAAFGAYRVVVDANPAASSYGGGRYQLVAKDERSIMYSCHGGRLYRKNINTFVKSTTCVSDGDVLAVNVKSCVFLYDVWTGGTQNGHLWMTLVVEREGESVNVAHGMHVDNIP